MLLKWNKNHFSSFLKGFSANKKVFFSGRWESDFSNTPLTRSSNLILIKWLRDWGVKTILNVGFSYITQLCYALQNFQLYSQNLESFSKHSLATRIYRNSTVSSVLVKNQTYFFTSNHTSIPFHTKVFINPDSNMIQKWNIMMPKKIDNDAI